MEGAIKRVLELLCSSQYSADQLMGDLVVIYNAVLDRGYSIQDILDVKYAKNNSKVITIKLIDTSIEVEREVQ